MKVNISKREELNTLLSYIVENSEAKWGLMKAQHMIEHLAVTMELSNGKRQLAQRTTEQEASSAKQIFIYTDVEMAMGIKSSLLGDVPEPFKFPNIAEAKVNLIKELDRFEQYFYDNPSVTPTHPRLGKLNYTEWLTFHNKHFTHHFKQFGIL